ncbi:hypothetical protein SK128_005840, partial [Halocaridina rubra]
MGRSYAMNQKPMIIIPEFVSTRTYKCVGNRQQLSILLGGLANVLLFSPIFYSLQVALWYR